MMNVKWVVQILPLIQTHTVVHLEKTDTRLANRAPLEVQRLRCFVNFHALRFRKEIMDIGQKLVQMLRAQGPFLVLHLRYEMDMLAFSGCTEGCTKEEAEKLTSLRYSFWVPLSCLFLLLRFWLNL